MTIHLDTNEFLTSLPTLAQALSAPLHAFAGGCTFTLPPDRGRGAVKAINLRPGLNLLCWHLQPHEDLVMDLASDHPHPLRLLIGKQGSIAHSLDAPRVQYRLEELYYSLSAGSGYVDQRFCIPGGQPLELCMVEIDRVLFEKRLSSRGGDGHQPLAPIFFDLLDPWPFLHRGPYCQATDQVLRDMAQAEQYDGLVRQTLLESKALELLSLALQQYLDHQQPSDNPLPLSEADTQALVQARRYVVAHYVDPPSLRELSQVVGLNEFKLKKGYRQLFRATVYEQVREEKLYRAQQLIAQGKWDIGVVAAKVGYHNKSHFAARFRERYGLNPKEYEQQMQNGQRSMVDGARHLVDSCPRS